MKKYSKLQMQAASGFYVVLVIACIISILGFIWTLADIFIGGTGKLAAFLALGLGLDLVIVAGLIAGLFFIIIYFYGISRKGRRVILNVAFRTSIVEEKYKNRKEIQLIVSGLLISIVVVMFGGVYAGFTAILDLFSDGTTSTLGAFSLAQLCLILGIVLLVLDGLCIFIIYFLNNGYYTILKLIGTLEK